MKKITLLLILLTVSLGYSQTDLIEDFDGATVPTFAPDNEECTPTSDPAGVPIGHTISTTQAASGASSLEIIASAAAHPWQGAKVNLQGVGMELTSNLLVKVDVYSLEPAGILAKVDASDGSGPQGTSAANHTGSGWETLNFNMADESDGGGVANGVYTTIRFYPLWGTAGGYAGQGGTACVSEAPINTIYIDNIVGTAPTASARGFKIAGLSTYPNPTQNSWNIKTQNVEMTSISVFDVLGKSVISISPKATEATINASSLRTGLYFAKIGTANGSQTVKFIKN